LNTPFFAASLALVAAICWGAGDFAGGVASRRAGTFRSVLLIYSVGLALVFIIALAREEQLTVWADLAWGAIAGLSGMVGVGALYHGFTQGRMGIVAPVSAVLATAIPVIFAALTHGLPRPLQLAGFAVALVGIWLLARPDSLGGQPKGLWMAGLAGLGFAGFFIGLGQVGEKAVFWPLVAGRAASIATMLLIALTTRRPLAPPRGAGWALLSAGILDVSGNLFFLLSVQNGRLDVTAVLGSLYPAVTAIFAALALKERLSRPQTIGIFAAVAAIVLITL
jgi:drug/metabolite transporter (DMT)-like permease